MSGSTVNLPGCMAEPELLLDSNIRLWVVLPIVFITFFVGVIRHYVSILLQSDKKLTLEQVSDRYVISNLKWETNKIQINCNLFELTCVHTQSPNTARF